MVFTGIEGIGRRAAAVALAMACNCSHPDFDPEPDAAVACGACGACRKIRSGVHPDVYQVRPTGSIIRIEQIRDLVHAASMKPFEARCRVMIVVDAHRMNPEAGNALLKLLEEPPARTLLVLTAPQTSDLLPTIVSRCQHLRFRPLSRKRLASILIEKHGMASERAEVLAAAADGSLARALELGGTGWEQRRSAWIDAFEALFGASTSAKLAFCEQLASERKTLDETLALLKIWIRDLAIHPVRPDLVVNRDLGDRLRQDSRRHRHLQPARWLAAIERAQRRIASNANPRLTLEALILELTHE